MNKEQATHSIAMCASKVFIESNTSSYINETDGYSKLVSDLTNKYIEAYNIGKKKISTD